MKLNKKTKPTKTTNITKTTNQYQYLHFVVLTLLTTTKMAKYYYGEPYCVYGYTKWKIRYEKYI